MREPSNNPPKLSVPEESLREAGFIDSGINEFIKLTSAFSDRLFEQSRNNCEPYHGKYEVTHDHVSNAADNIYKHRPKSKWSTILDFLLYFFTLVVGIGGGHITEDWGKWVVVIGVVVCAIVYMLKINEQNK